MTGVARNTNGASLWPLERQQNMILEGLQVQGPVGPYQWRRPRLVVWVCISFHRPLNLKAPRPECEGVELGGDTRGEGATG